MEVVTSAFGNLSVYVILTYENTVIAILFTNLSSLETVSVNILYSNRLLVNGSRKGIKISIKCR